MLESIFEAVCEDFVKINMTGGGCVAVGAVTTAGKLAANVHAPCQTCLHLRSWQNYHSYDLNPSELRYLLTLMSAATVHFSSLVTLLHSLHRLPDEPI